MRAITRSKPPPHAPWNRDDCGCDDTFSLTKRTAASRSVESRRLRLEWDDVSIEEQWPPHAPWNRDDCGGDVGVDATPSSGRLTLRGIATTAAGEFWAGGTIFCPPHAPWNRDDCGITKNQKPRGYRDRLTLRGIATTAARLSLVGMTIGITASRSVESRRLRLIWRGDVSRRVRRLTLRGIATTAAPDWRTR